MPKKTVKKTTVTKKAAAAKKPAVATSLLPKNVKYDEALTKSEMNHIIAEAVGLTRKQVSNVFECLSEVIHGHLRAKGAGACTLGGLLKIELKRKAATKARKGVNPFTGEQIMIKAKPARNIVKVKALKKLKEMVD